jgi:nucleotide-binding universal stress UspA family protein
VLLALDGSAAATTGLPVARALASQLGAAVEILHVAAQAMAATEVRRLLRVDDALDLHVEVGDAVAGVLRALDDPRTGLVVLTTHGEAREGRPLASVAEAVAARTTRPLLLVRPEAPGRIQHHGGLRRLLVPLDGSPATAAALLPATELASRLGATLDVLHVVHPTQAGTRERGSVVVSRYFDQPHHEWCQWMREFTGLCHGVAGGPEDARMQVHVRHGDVSTEIARFASEHDADAIVLVRRSRLEAERAQILRGVLERTPCPVLLVAASMASEQNSFADVGIGDPERRHDPAA